MTTHHRTRTAGWVATAGIAAALLLPTVALAQTGHPTPISDTGVSQSCTGGPGGSTITPQAGQVAWLFVHSGVSHSASGTLTAVYTSAGSLHASSYIQGGVKYLVTTAGPDTITAFSDTIAGGQLVLSHVCYGPLQSEQPSSSPSEQPSSSPSEQPSSTPSEEPSSSPSEQPSSSPSDQPTTSPSQPVQSEQPSTDPSTSPSTDPSTSPSTDPSTSPSATPQGSVLAQTGAPQITPPPTDSLVGPASATGTSWQLIVLALAGFLASLLTLTPATARKRR